MLNAVNFSGENLTVNLQRKLLFIEKGFYNCHVHFTGI